MRYVTFLMAILFCFASMATAETKLTGLFGSKDLGSDWAPVDDHDIVGVELDFSADDHPLSYVIRYQIGDASGSVGATDFDVVTDEFLLGARYTMPLAKSIGLNGYVGGGYAAMFGDLTTSTGSLSESGSGYWIGGGLILGSNKSRTFNIGVDWTYSDVGEIDLGPSSVDTGGLTTAITIGWTF